MKLNSNVDFKKIDSNGNVQLKNKLEENLRKTKKNNVEDLDTSAEAIDYWKEFGSLFGSRVISS